MMERPKALALLSGGLDSTLAIKVMMDLGVEVEAVHFLTVFCNCTSSRRQGCKLEARRVSEQLSIRLKVMNVSREYIEIVKHPRHGRGSSMNPCIDCRIFMHRKAKQYMEQTGAQFIITGEVLGQRPMSQHRKALSIIDRESELEGWVLRPLSAQLLEPTIPERVGLVDRARLLSIRGRSRKEQFALAKEKGITGRFCPAGGCLLTDKSFGAKLKDLLDHNEGATLSDMVTLKYGRHFRLSETLKVIVARNQQENKWLFDHRDGHCVFRVLDYPGPIVLAVGSVGTFKEKVAAIAARYSGGKEQARLRVLCRLGETHETLDVAPVSEDLLERWRIG